MGRAAAEADEQRKPSARGIEVRIDSASSSTNTASTRRTHETTTSDQAFAASRGVVVCSATQQTNLKRAILRWQTIFGMKTTSAPASTPATATTISPAWTQPVGAAIPALIAAIGVRAAL